MVKKHPLASRFRSHDTLDESPDHALVGVVSIPEYIGGPWRLIGKRVAMAVAALCLGVVVVWFDRGGYTGGGGANGEMTLVDCFYYATVSLSTTGYGDVTPITQQARLINTLVITPLRVVFLILLVGTTLSVLTEQSRQAFKIQRHRRRRHRPPGAQGRGRPRAGHRPRLRHQVRRTQTGGGHQGRRCSGRHQH